MTTPAMSPELARAAELLQSQQREAAGRLLKAYLSAHPRDAEGWWLMSQAVSQPANVRTCLERVLRLRPDDARARARLAELDRPDEPGDSFFSFGPAPSARPSSGPAPAPPPAARPRRQTPTDTTGVPASFDPTLDLGVPFDPFAGIATENDPFAALRGQQPGTGSQSDWGPGLGFVSEKLATASGTPPARTACRSGLSSTLVGTLVIILALIALISVLVLAARRRGWLPGGNLPEMDTLDAATFTLEFPEEWGGVCKADPDGYPVCGIANDPRYNEVDYYTGAQGDTAQMLSSALSGLLSFEQAPDLLVSAIIMDVPQDSGRYDPSSQAKEIYEIYQEYGSMGADDYTLDYDERDPVIDGYDASVYRLTLENASGALESFVMGGSGDSVFYEVYIPHGDKLLWMAVRVYAFNDQAEIPYESIEHMIDSIDLKTS